MPAGKGAINAYAIVQRQERLRQRAGERCGGRGAGEAGEGVAEQRLVDEDALRVGEREGVTSTGSSRKHSSDWPRSATLASASYA